MTVTSHFQGFDEEPVTVTDLDLWVPIGNGIEVLMSSVDCSDGPEYFFIGSQREDREGVMWVCVEAGDSLHAVWSRVAVEGGELSPEMKSFVNTGVLRRSIR